MKKASRAMAWTMTLSTSVWLSASSVLPASALHYKYSWVSQTPSSVTADGTAHYVNANPGDTVAMSVTLTNKSTSTIKAKDALGAIPAGKQVQVGAYGIGVRGDALTPWLDASSFVLNGNRLAYYNGVDVAPGAQFTVSWNVKIASTAANGTYNLYFRPVVEYLGWTNQVAWNGTTLSFDKSDIFTRFIIGGSVTPSTGGLSVSLASGTPAAGQVANSSNTNFTKITLTPASGATVSITSLYVTRTGLSTDTAVENVKLIRASDNVQMGNTAGGFNANHKAQIFFSPAMALSSATDFYLRAGITAAATAPAGNTVGLGILDNADVVSNATAVTGAPANGNLMTIVNVTVGTVTLAEYGSVGDSTPAAGDKGVVTNTFEIQAGSTEDISLEQITALKAGSANSSDSANITLINDTAGTTVATLASWNSENKAVFNFSPALTIGRGNIVRFTIKLDVVSGSGLTINTDVIDGTDELVVAKGLTYGYYLNPATSWTANAGGSNNTGQGDNNQTVEAGGLTITKSATSAATGNVGVADNQILGTWDFQALGEEIRISALHVDLDGTAADGGTEQEDNFQNGRLFDETGNIVAGPVDGSATDSAADRALDFTQTFVVPTGIHKYTLKVRVLSGAATDETIITAITAAGDVTAKTVRTNTSVVATGVPAALNTMTVKGANLTVTTLAVPVARSIVDGATDFIWAQGSLDATNSGEDVKVTAISIKITPTNDGLNSADADNIVNMELWADLTSANSSRGDAFETKITNTEQPTGSNAVETAADFNFSLTTPLVIKKNTFNKIAFVADASTSVVADEDFTVCIDTDAADAVTAAGVDSGVATDPTATGAGQTMTIAASGAVTVTVDSASPQSDILVAGGTEKTIGIWRAVTNTVEGVELDQFMITNASATVGGGVDDSQTTTWYLYADRDGTGAKVTPFKVATVTNGATVTFNIADNTVRVPADSVLLLTVKADISLVDGTSVQNNDTIDMNIAALDATAAASDMDFTGLSSNTTLGGAGTDGITTADHSLYKSRPYVSFAADTPSGVLTPSGAAVTTLLAKVNVTADSAFDIAFTSNGGGNDSLMTFKLAVVVNDDTGPVDTLGSKVVDMGTGTTLYAVAADVEAGADIVADFDTGGADLIIPAGTTKVLGVYGDTRTFEDTGDSIQVWMDDGTANGVTFGTTVTADSTANNYDESAIILRGDKFGGTLAKA